MSRVQRRAILRWCLTALTSLTGLAFVLSGRYYLEFHHKGSRCWGFGIVGGTLAVYEINPPQSPTSPGLHVGSRPDGWDWHSYFKCGVDPDFLGNRELVFPIWWVACALSVPTIGSWIFYAANRRRGGIGRCAKCGYSRRGLAADAKCPECGTTPTPAA